LRKKVFGACAEIFGAIAAGADVFGDGDRCVLNGVVTTPDKAAFETGPCGNSLGRIRGTLRGMGAHNVTEAHSHA